MDTKKKIPYFFLYVLSFYPLMKEALASITAILFLVTTLFFYWDNFGKRYKKYGIKPILINCGFYFFLLFSILYSDHIFIGIKKVQSSLLLLFFPIVIFYFFPKVKKQTIKIFSYGFILSNFVLFLYFFDILAQGLAIDRFAGLMDKNILEQALAINTYPYEFVLSKAEKHLDVLFEPHKVYLSLHFLTALLLSINLIANFKIAILKKILLGILSFLFVLAIVYSQAITTVLSLVLILVLAPFFYFRRHLEKIIFGVVVLSFLTIGWLVGLLDTYKNKNTDSIAMLLDYVISSVPMEEGVDKRIYIYDCSINLIKKEILFGYGVGNVQQKLNDCYQEKNYVVAEFRSLGSEINTHNYYFHMWLSAGLFALLFLLYMFGHNFYIALKLKNFTFLFFLLMFSLSLLTENVLVRMYGVFLFAVMNSLFYSNCKIDAGNGE